MLRYTSIALMAIVLWGCPYKSQVALDDAKEKVDKELIGKWIPDSQVDKENPEYYTIAMRDSVHYDVDHYQYNEDEKDYALKQYVGHTTRLESILFMNLQESGTREFLIYRLDVFPGVQMNMYEVTNNIDEQFDNSKSMREFFQKYMKLSFFYNTDEAKLIKKDL